jgi:hypothetical protein
VDLPTNLYDDASVESEKIFMTIGVLIRSPSNLKPKRSPTSIHSDALGTIWESIVFEDEDS